MSKKQSAEKMPPRTQPIHHPKRHPDLISRFATTGSPGNKTCRPTNTDMRSINVSDAANNSQRAK